MTECGKLWCLHGNCSQESLSVKATCLHESRFIRVTQHHQTIHMTLQHNTCTVQVQSFSKCRVYREIYLRKWSWSMSAFNNQTWSVQKKWGQAVQRKLHGFQLFLDRCPTRMLHLQRKSNRRGDRRPFSTKHIFGLVRVWLIRGTFTMMSLVSYLMETLVTEAFPWTNFRYDLTMGDTIVHPAHWSS